MAAPTNSGERDMPIEDFDLDLSLLVSPSWSSPWHFLPSSSSMVMLYQGSNYQYSTDNSLQNQQQHEEDMVDPAPFLAGDWALSQQLSTVEESNIVMHYETPTFIDQEGFSQLNSDTLPSNQSLSATVDTNSGIVMEIHLPQFLPEARQENPDEDFGNSEVDAVGIGIEGTGKGNEDFGSYEVEVVGMGVEGTGEGGTEEGHLNSGCWAKGKGKVETLGGNRGNKKTNKIKITLEDILQAEGMNLEDAAKKFKVSRSTLKRVCREYGIISWPPSKKNENISQSCPKESPAVVDQEGVQQMNCDILPFEQALAAIVDTNSVVLKVRWLDSIILKIRLPKPWKMVELEQQVEKRLKIEPGTYYIRYKDEENELITILCDDDLREHISSSRLRNTISTEIFLVPK